MSILCTLLCYAVISPVHSQIARATEEKVCYVLVHCKRSKYFLFIFVTLSIRLETSTKCRRRTLRDRSDSIEIKWQPSATLMNLLIGFEHFTIDIFLHAASSGSFSKFYMATTTTEEILIYDKTQFSFHLKCNITVYLKMKKDLNGITYCLSRILLPGEITSSRFMIS